jgi:hypothetical protein
MTAMEIGEGDENGKFTKTGGNSRKIFQRNVTD